MLHEGHKKRLRQKACVNIDTLQPHEIIELMLNFGIVRKNTNPIAHELINKFGSVANVLDADISALMQVEGVGETSACLLHLIPKLCNVYNKSRASDYSKISSLAEAKEFFRVLYSCTANEELYVLCLNKADKIIANLKIAEGSLDSILIDMRECVSKIASYNPVKVYLAHNHILTDAYPSDADLRFTKIFRKNLEALRIKFLDHIIISQNNIFSFDNAHLLDD